MIDSDSDDFSDVGSQDSDVGVDETQFRRTQNRHYDESLEVDDASNSTTEDEYQDSLKHYSPRSLTPFMGNDAGAENKLSVSPSVSPGLSRKQIGARVAGKLRPSAPDYNDKRSTDEVDDDHELASKKQMLSAPSVPATRNDDDDEDEPQGVLMYNPDEFSNLNVETEVKDLFDWITHYKPHEIELETQYKPFIPDFIPACGDIDCFVKVPRPDGKNDMLGLTVLDEPSGAQSDPTALDLQLRVASKKSNLQPVTVRSIENADKNSLKITAWINNIQKVHSQKPPASVTYSNPMPELDQLMEPMSEGLQKFLETKKDAIPPAAIDLSLKDYAKILCALLDIPIYEGNLIQSLHLAFSLYEATWKKPEA